MTKRIDETVEVWVCSRKGGCGWRYESPIYLRECWHKCKKGDASRRAMTLEKKGDK